MIKNFTLLFQGVPRHIPQKKISRSLVFQAKSPSGINFQNQNLILRKMPGRQLRSSAPLHSCPLFPENRKIKNLLLKKAAGKIQKRKKWSKNACGAAPLPNAFAL